MGSIRRTVTPMYIQIADTVAARILNGQLRAGESIGSQRELEQEFRVSLVTIRQALTLLKERGLIVSRQGKGFFVKEQGMVEVPLPGLANLSAVMAAQGRTVTIDVPLFEVAPTPDSVADMFGVATGTEALHVHRLHRLDGQPVALADIWGKAEFAQHLSAEDYRHTEVSAMISGKLPLNYGKADQTIRAVGAPRYVAKMLDVKPDSPLLLARKLFKSTVGEPLFLIVLYYRSDIFEFRTRLNQAQMLEVWLPH